VLSTSINLANMHRGLATLDVAVAVLLSNLPAEVRLQAATCLACYSLGLDWLMMQAKQVLGGSGSGGGQPAATRA
jgi:hypothetical protein